MAPRRRRRHRRPDQDGRALPALGRPRLAAERPVLAIAQRVVGLDQRVELARPLVDDRRLRVAQVALDRELVRVAVGAVDLDRVERALDGVLGGVPLGEARLARVAQALVLEPGRAPDEQPAHLGAGGHLGDHLLDQLVLADLLAERVALVGVARRDASRHAWASPTAPAATVKRPWSMALIATRKPSPSSPIRCSTGHGDVVEVDQAGVAGPDPELAVERAGRQARHAALEQERGHALVLLRSVDAWRRPGSGRRCRPGEIQIFWPLSR